MARAVKIIIQVDEEDIIEIDLEEKVLVTALPVGEPGEIRVEDGDPPIVHLTLPFGKLAIVEQRL
jgi:hypothetical protein